MAIWHIQEGGEFSFLDLFKELWASSKSFISPFGQASGLHIKNWQYSSLIKDTRRIWGYLRPSDRYADQVLFQKCFTTAQDTGWI